MNEREATDLLHRLAAGVQAVPPPIEHLTEGGRSMRQRRRLRQVVGVAAVTGLALLVGAVVLRPDGGSGPDPAPIAPPQRTADPPTAAAGTRLVGLGQVVVEVPKDWVVAQNGCPRDTGVIFRFPDTAAEAGRLGHCPSTSEDQPYASLAVGSMVARTGGEGAEHDAILDAVRAAGVLQPPRCPRPSGLPTHVLAAR